MDRGEVRGGGVAGGGEASRRWGRLVGGAPSWPPRPGAALVSDAQPAVGLMTSGVARLPGRGRVLAAAGPTRRVEVLAPACRHGVMLLMLVYMHVNNNKRTLQCHVRTFTIRWLISRNMFASKNRSLPKIRSRILSNLILITIHRPDHSTILRTGFEETVRA